MWGWWGIRFLTLPSILYSYIPLTLLFCLFAAHCPHHCLACTVISYKKDQQTLSEEATAKQYLSQEIQEFCAMVFIYNSILWMLLCLSSFIPVLISSSTAHEAFLCLWYSTACVIWCSCSFGCFLHVHTQMCIVNVTVVYNRIDISNTERREGER